MRKKPCRWGLVPGQTSSELWKYKPIVIPYWEQGSDPRSVDYRRLRGARTGSITNWIVGEPGIGMTFDGTSDFLDFTNVVDTQFSDTTSFTIVSVFRPEADSTFRNVLRKDNGTGTRALWGIRQTSSNKLDALFGITSATLGSITSNLTLTQRVYASALVRDVKADQIRLFIDGVLDNEVADGSTGTWTVSLGALRTAVDSGGSAEKWKGEKFLDIIFPFNALTNEEARQLTLDPWVMLRQAPLNVGRVPDVAVGAIMNQLQSGNVGADLYNGTIL